MKASVLVDKLELGNASQSNLMKCFGKELFLDRNSRRSKGITKAIGNMICTDFQPYSIVEDKGFKALMKELEPRYVIPSRHTFSRSIVPEMFQKKKKELFLEIAKDKPFMKSISITTDIWSSRAKDSFIAFTAQYMDNDFLLKHKTLGCNIFPGSHTGETISVKVTEMLQEWDLADGTIPVYIVSDNASNMKAALQNKTGWYHLLCMDHTLQLAIGDAKSGLGVETLLDKASKIASRYKRSVVAKEKLECFQNMFNLPLHEMISMVPTRWNSEFLMLERLCEQKKAVSAELIEAGKESLTSMQWQLASGLVDVLRPIAQFTKDLGSVSVPTLSMALPALFCIEHELTSFIRTTEKGSGHLFAKNLLRSIKERFSECHSDDTNILAMLVDPRYKTVIMEDNNIIVKATELFTDKVKEVYHIHKEKAAEHQELSKPKASAECFSDCSSGIPSNDGNSVWMAIQKRRQMEKSRALQDDDLIKKEVDSYLGQPAIALSSDPCQWWQINQYQFRNISVIAKKYLGIPATEVPSERLFSAAGNIVSVRRECLKANNVEMLVFLHDNL